MRRNETGHLGEDIARKYLEGKGYEIIEQNYKTKYAEIDLVGMKNKEMVFFEVRSKRDEAFGTPEETLDHKKLWKVKKNAEAYLAFKKWQGPCRIDAVCIVLDGPEIQRINHYENVV